MPLCTNCGQQIQADAAYCPYCKQPQLVVQPQPPTRQAKIPPAPPKKSHTRYLLIVVIVILLLILGSIVGYAFYTGSTAGHSSGSSSNHQSTTHSTACNLSTPLQLVSAQQSTVKVNGTFEPSMVLVWSNCSGQKIQFLVSSANLTATVSTNGTVSKVNGSLATPYVPWPPNTVGPGGIVTVTMVIDFYSQVSPNAMIQHVVCTVAAEDPTSHQPVSAQTAVSVT